MENFALNIYKIPENRVPLLCIHVPADITKKWYRRDENGSLIPVEEVEMVDDSRNDKKNDHVIDVDHFLLLSRVFKHFDGDVAGKITEEEVKNCLTVNFTKCVFCGPKGQEPSGVSYDDLLKVMKDFDGNADRKFTTQDQNNYYVKVDEICSNISKTRDIFLGLTGQAAVALFAFARSPPLYIIMSVNALAFFSLSVSACLRGSKHKVAEKISGVVGIAAAVVEFCLVTGLFFA